MSKTESKKNEYEHIEEAMHKYKRNKKFIDTISLNHSKAYTFAVEKHLMDDENLLDLSRLKQLEYQRKVADEMTDFYIVKAKKEFKTKVNDEIKDAMLLKMYTGYTKDQLRNIIHSEKEGFTKQFFETRLAPAFTRSVEESISKTPYEHLQEEHKDDIIKKIEASKFVDTSKMSLEDSISLLETYVERGGILESDIEGQPFHKKKQKNKK